MTAPEPEPAPARARGDDDHCKRCGLVLEEGRAFELAGNRWHVECFCCSSCSQQLDCNTNLLVLGDGSLICNNCSYHCNICQKKIEDLAILTGNLAFCSSCFVCRNCKNKIHDLKYARTSQGIFCMSCHETLLARKRRNAAAKAAALSAQNAAMGKLTPGGSSSSPSASNGSGPSSEGYFDRSLAPSMTRSHSRLSYASFKDKSLPAVPVDNDDHDKRPSHRHNHSTSKPADTPPPPPPPFYQTHSSKSIHTLASGPAGSNSGTSSNSSLNDLAQPQRDTAAGSSSSLSSKTLPASSHFRTNSSSSSHSHRIYATADASGASSVTVPDTAQPPHNGSANSFDTALESPPASRMAAKTPPSSQYRHFRHHSQPRPGDTESPSPGDIDGGFLPIQLDLSSIPSKPELENLSRRNAGRSMLPPPKPPVANFTGFATTTDESDPDSGAGSSSSSHTDTAVGLDDPLPIVSVKDDSPTRTPRPDPKSVASPRNAIYLADEFASSSWSLGDDTSKPDDSPTRPSLATRSGLGLSSSRSNIPAKLDLSGDRVDQDASRQNLMALIPERSQLRSTSPRPPQANPDAAPVTPHLRGDSAAEVDSATSNYSAPRLSLNRVVSPGFSTMLMNEFPVTLDGAVTPLTATSLTVPFGGHRRSVSESKHLHGNRMSPEDPGSLVSSPTGHLDSVDRAAMMSQSQDMLMRQLVDAKKRIAGLERALREKEEGSSAQYLEDDIQEKRKTVAGLEARGVVARKEIMLLENARDRDTVDSPADLIDQFTNELASVKSALMAEIADLVAERDALVVGNAKLSKVRDTAVEESSILNIKNSQLADMNNELTRQMIEKFGPYNTLGPNLPRGTAANPTALRWKKEAQSPSRRPVEGPQSLGKEKDSPQTSNGGYVAGDEPMVTVLDGNGDSRGTKDRQHNGRRFWKRPGAAVAKGLTKVFANEGDSASSTQEFYDGPGDNSFIGIANSNGRDMSSTSSGAPSLKQGAPRNGRNGWFKSGDHNPNGSGLVSSAALAAAVTLTQPSSINGPSLLKGEEGEQSSLQSGAGMSSSGTSDSLSDKESRLMGESIDRRIAYENRRIPVIVTRCIEEVESRGLQFEGVYRKSGAKSQIVSIEEAFQKSKDGPFDEVLSGDISGVTSAVKQYLRYLPVPLITFDAYDAFIRASSNATDVDGMRTVINSLPTAHRDCLEFVIRHLAKVTTYSADNLMTTRNLAVVFAPTLARDLTGEREMVDMQIRNDGTQLLIDHCEAIFTGF